MQYTDWKKEYQRKIATIPSVSRHRPSSAIVTAENYFERNGFKILGPILDIGCGKGRAMCVAANYGFKKVSGIEWAEKLSCKTKQNLELIKSKFTKLESSVITGDAALFDIPNDTDCIFLFNPFDEYIMEKVVTNIFKSIVKHPRTLHVIYANPLYKRLLLEGEFYETFHYQRYHYFEVSILSIRH